MGVRVMGEFGRISFIKHGFCIDCFGAGPFIITHNGKSWRFEDSDRFGPSLVKKNGDISADPFPPERSPFWKIHSLWVKQGRRLAEDGQTCIYEMPIIKPTKVKKIGRTYIVIENGDDGGETIIVKDEP